ncbi:B9D2 protein, partial [Indicator maculatus]|nr:B9D2 protein [Indicator maculatus]
LGYGFCHLPSSPGCHSVTCVTWRPLGTPGERLRRLFLGGGPQLLPPEVPNLSTEPSQRCRLSTQAGGRVWLQLGVILRNFSPHGVLC